ERRGEYLPTGRRRARSRSGRRLSRQAPGGGSRAVRLRQEHARGRVAPSGVSGDGLRPGAQRNSNPLATRRPRPSGCPRRRPADAAPAPWRRVAGVALPRAADAPARRQSRRRSPPRHVQARRGGGPGPGHVTASVAGAAGRV
ncbi:MAG: hypothetical protein AVDCRST_MAG19-295, partial [uncultured Thermomicrobiales bacterium]